MHPWRLAADGSKGCTTRAGLAERMGNMCGGLGEELSSCRSMFVLAKQRCVLGAGAMKKGVWSVCAPCREM